MALRSLVVAGLAAIAAGAAFAPSAQALPISIGVSFNGGPISYQASGDGTAFGSWRAVGPNGAFSVRDTASGTDSPDLSNTVTVQGASKGSVTLYVTEYGLSPGDFPGFQSIFADNATQGAPSVSFSSYVYECAETTCGSADLYQTPTSSQYGAGVIGTSGKSQTALLATKSPLQQSFAMTEVFTVTFLPSGGATNASITVDDPPLGGQPVPEPASLAVIGVGLLGLGTLRIRRRR